MSESTTIIDLDPAARQVTTLLSGVTDEHLSARTPCPEYTVGDLLDHLMGLTLAFTHAARKSTLPGHTDIDPSAPGAVSAANLPVEWRRILPGRLEDLVAAWRERAAWEGMTEAGGVTMPAEVAGVVALDELVIHGWDLARATGQPARCDEPSAEAIHALLSQSPNDEDGGGLFGPVVDVPATAPLLDRALGLSGRDPAWTP